MTAAPNILPFIPPPRAACVDPRARGFHAVYRDGEANRCPGCGRGHWWIGRVMAECGFCSTALPIERPGTTYPKGGGSVRLNLPRVEVFK